MDDKIVVVFLRQDWQPLIISQVCLTLPRSQQGLGLLALIAVLT